MKARINLNNQIIELKSIGCNCDGVVNAQYNRGKIAKGKSEPIWSVQLLALRCRWIFKTSVTSQRMSELKPRQAPQVTPQSSPLFCSEPCAAATHLVPRAVGMAARLTTTTPVLPSYHHTIVTITNTKGRSTQIGRISRSQSETALGRSI